MSALANSPLRRRRKQGGEAMQRWNKMADDFAERTGDRGNAEKRQKTLLWLEQSGALFPGAKVIDIGAGPGNWAIPLAKAGAEVTAVEPAEGMVRILRERMDQAEVNCVVEQLTWQQADLDALGWRGGFDLVFASMTPGVDSPAMLYKMLDACRNAGGFCYLSAFAGRSWQEWYRELWLLLFNEQLDGQVNDIIYPFNLAYALGFRPELRFDRWDRQVSWTREKAIADFTTHLEGFAEMTDTVRTAIANHVDQRLKDGLFTETRSGCRGMMLWDTRVTIGDGKSVTPADHPDNRFYRKKKVLDRLDLEGVGQGQAEDLTLAPLDQGDDIHPVGLDPVEHLGEG